MFVVFGCVSLCFFVFVPVTHLNKEFWVGGVGREREREKERERERARREREKERKREREEREEGMGKKSKNSQQSQGTIRLPSISLPSLPSPSSTPSLSSVFSSPSTNPYRYGCAGALFFLLSFSFCFFSFLFFFLLFFFSFFLSFSFFPFFFSFLFFFKRCFISDGWGLSWSSSQNCSAPRRWFLSFLYSLFLLFFQS